MGTETLEGRERAELCDLLEKLGPDAPTLCEGWTTADLAAHLYVREHAPLRAGPGIALGSRVPRLAKMTDEAMAKAKAELGFPKLIEEIRKGPPMIARIPGLGGTVNLVEYFVHHEDVRRANGEEPRIDRADLDEKLWTRQKSLARIRLLTFRPYGVELAWAGHDNFQARRGQPTVTVTGTPQEVTLYFSGRKGVAQVEITGDQKAIEALGNKSFGL